jgi:hypothetical protein
MLPSMVASLVTDTEVESATEVFRERQVDTGVMALNTEKEEISNSGIYLKNAFSPWFKSKSTAGMLLE